MQYQFANRDHILFTIDASESMHQPVPDEANEAGLVRGKSVLHQALRAIVDIERRKVITGPSDSIGVLLYNVDVSRREEHCSRLKLTFLQPEKTSSQNYKPGTHVLQPLQQINAEQIKKLIKLVDLAEEQYAAQEDPDEPTIEPPILRETFPPATTELNVADVLVTCNFLFRDA